jgi:hypothetical protein
MAHDPIAPSAPPSLRWAQALEQALDASLANIPALLGRTLVLIDSRCHGGRR